jgi:tetratricopeptide (TPR) repeat protein
LVPTVAAYGQQTASSEANAQMAVTYYNRGVAKAQKGDLDGAVADFGQAIQLNPKYADAYNGRGFVYYQQKNYEKAINDYNEAIRLAPNLTNAYWNRGNAFKDQGENEKADADFVKAAQVEQATQGGMAAESVTVRLVAENSSGQGGRWTKARALEWAKKTGNTLEYIDRPNDPSATLSEYVHHWAVKRDIDVYVIDARLRKS